ncbi:hypothetical protein ACJ41O_009722 [Fusarium nematophilum]
MAQQTSTNSNESLIQYLWRNKLITRPVVRSAFLKVDRGHYAPRNPYENSPQVLAHQSTISAPCMHAKAVEYLLPYLLPVRDRQHAGEHDDEVVGLRGRPRRVLDIGSGSGFLVHLFAELAGEGSVVVGVDHIEDMKRLGEANMRKSAEGQALLSSGRARFRLGDGRLGWYEATDAIEASSEDDRDGWDVIHVGAAAAKLHHPLVQQLRKPGRLLIPMAEVEGDWSSAKYLWTVDKDGDGHVTKTKHEKVRYVSLMDAPEEC